MKKQLEATELELAKQKWLFEQFLHSPSWRITSPLRWVARQGRSIRRFVSGRPSDSPDQFVPSIPAISSADAAPETSFSSKESFRDFCMVQLRILLGSDARLSLPSSISPKVSIIVVLHNRAELTLACLRSIRENATAPAEVIIVDNASTDDTPRLLQQIAGARIIRNETNVHFLAAVNQAAQQARGENLLLLNNDAQLLPGSLDAALMTLDSKTDIGAVGGRIILLDGMLQEAGSVVWRDGSCLGYGRGDDPFAPMYMFRRDVDYCSGAFLLTPRRIWQKLGGFDETFKPAYYEETNYCVRLWELGLRVVYEPAAVILHYEFASSESIENATSLQREHQSLFAQKHATFVAQKAVAGPEGLLEARMRNASKRVLIIDDRPPHVWLGSGFPRARAILLSLVEQGYFVTVFPTDKFDEGWNTIYSDQPREVEFMIGLGRSMLEAFLRNRRGYYQTIVVSRPHNMRLLQPLIESRGSWFENVNIVYDAEALFSNRWIAQSEVRGSPVSAADAQRSIEEEIRLADAADCVVSVSAAEAAIFRRHGIAEVEVLGHALRFDPTCKSFSDRSGFLFVGAIRDEAGPNGDSIHWFIVEVLPRIRELLGADTSFTIAGVVESEVIRRLAMDNSVGLAGFVPDLTEHYDAARVFVAPTRFGAGIPHKVHEAAARGLPVVATRLVSDQLGWADGRALAVGGDSAEFAAKCVDLYTNEPRWSSIREAALNAVRSECSIEAFEDRLKQILGRGSDGVYRRTVRAVPTRTN
jgi:GT2 family glycosyltransferase/glycosyltransferase involved in cell wall biosynthesis